ncbi:hypothetical protein [Thermopirellula anaerolimosa]
MMRRTWVLGPFAALTVFAVLNGAGLSAMAQSGSRSGPPSASRTGTIPLAGSNTREARQAPLALQGYCAVSLLEMRKWVKGNPAFGAVYDGRTYLFADEQGRQMFLQNPVKYIPALGGDDVVAWVKTNKRVAGDIRYAAIHEGRLFLFAGDNAKQSFLDNPSAFANADLAYGGKCVVCLVGMQQDVPGRPEFTVIHKGLRYLFASAAQRDAFLANPAKYEVPATSPGLATPGSGVRSSSAGSATRPSTGSGSGSR